MEHKVIPNENGNGFTFAFVGGDVEFANPHQYFSEYIIKSRTIIYSKLLLLKNPKFTPETVEKVALEKAKADWNKHLDEIKKTEIPQNIISLLKTTSKKEQEKLLKGAQLTPEIILAFIFKAHDEFGFTYSQYNSQHFPKTIEKGSLPTFASLNKETGKIEKIGDTKLTNGQIKQAIEQRKVVATKFFDNGTDWHAFFITYRSIDGAESWKNGQPHYHYISDKFEIKREDAVNQFKSNHYPKTSVHIELLGYGKQPKK